MRRFLIALLALALLAPAASAQSHAQNPPKLPNSTKGTKKCTTVSRSGYSFRVYVTKGKGRISCKKARKIVARPLFDVKGFQYFDWTKAGNGPWSDVYCRSDHKVVIGAIMRDA